MIYTYSSIFWLIISRVIQRLLSVLKVDITIFADIANSWRWDAEERRIELCNLVRTVKEVGRRQSDWHWLMHHATVFVEKHFCGVIDPEFFFQSLNDTSLITVFFQMTIPPNLSISITWKHGNLKDTAFSNV